MVAEGEHAHEAILTLTPALTVILTQFLITNPNCYHYSRLPKQ
jgi:hypothetical protein